MQESKLEYEEAKKYLETGSSRLLGFLSKKEDKDVFLIKEAVLKKLNKWDRICKKGCEKAIPVCPHRCPNNEEI